MENFNKYGRNNRQCISSLGSKHTFYDFTSQEDFYLCNDMLNISYIYKDDLVKFVIRENDGQIFKIYGYVEFIINSGHTTFLVCKHFNEHGEVYLQDYKYSAFYHAFEKLNNVNEKPKRWEVLTNNKDVVTPQSFFDAWYEYNDKNEDEVINEDNESEYKININTNNKDILELKAEIKKLNSVINMLTDRVLELENMHPNVY